MILFLIKSAACMAIFLIFYKLFLEKESMHFFKRYFLLAAIAISLVIPAVVFTEVIYIEPISTSFTPTEDYSLETYHAPSIESIDYTYWSLLSIYGLGVLFFSLQFFKNLYQIKNTIQNNPKQQTNSIIKVLLSLQIVPHTFFNYIFLNKQKFEANEIPPAVLLHEETHAKQKHSIDILVLEILQIVFWFNPLIYLFKKSIKLNHEFLADSAVLNNGLEKSDYQKILLAFSSNAAEPQLANAINYSSIKKRFTVMKKETSRKVSLVKSFLIIPIAAILLLGFSEKEILEIQKEGSAQEQQTLLSGIKKELENVNALKLNYTDTPDVTNNNSNLKNFEFQISRINQGLRLESMIGSNWKELEFNLPNNQPQLINKSGLVKSNNNGGIKNPQDFLISIQKTEKEIFLKGLSGTRWVELSFTLFENDTQKVNENGMVISKKENEARQEAILKYNSLAKKYKATSIEKRIINFDDLNELENLNRIIGENQSYSIPQFLPENIIVDKKTILVIVDKNQIYLNTKKVSLEAFKAEFNSLTRGWESDYESINSKFNFNETPIELLHKIENEFKKTNFSKKNRTVTLLNLKSAKSNHTLTVTLRYNKLAKKYNAIPIEKRIIPLKDLYLLETIYRNMSPAQKEAAQPFPECLPKTNQEGATKKQITAYNNLAKKYNSMMAKGGNIRIVKSDVDQLKHIYGLMSEEQKGNAQPFPDFPEPPPAPQVPEAQNEREEAAKTIKRIIEEQDPYDTNTLTRIEPSVVNSPKAPMAPRVKKGEKNDIPPPPLTEKIEIIQTAVDEVIENQDIIAVENVRVYRHNVDEKSANSPNLMEDLQSLAKRDAQFYFNGKEVSTKEGLQIVKNKKNIYVETLPYSNKKPKVKIYTNKNDVSIPPPPAPPKPPSPLDYVINAAKKEATFMYEGKIVSSDKAIDLLKNNKELNIESRNKNGKQIVRITKDPVTIE